jgi:hypothetical protein
MHDSVRAMTDSARAMSTEDALAELRDLEANGQILLEGVPTLDRVSLDGWDPFTQQKQNGNVAGVLIRYLPSGSRAGQPFGGSAPDRMDPRNALALVRFCEWLGANHGVTELYHLGMTDESIDKRTGLPRNECHGQGRAVDFCGVKIVFEDGSETVRTVWDDWGTVHTALTPDGHWPPGTGRDTSYRLDADDAPDPDARDFFRSVYEFIATQWQDRTNTPDPENTLSEIGGGSFIMHPDHRDSFPNGKSGREAHRNHIHMQIGVTGTA